VLGQAQHVGDCVRDVVRAERLEPLVHRCSTLLVAVEADFGELRLDEPGSTAETRIGVPATSRFIPSVSARTPTWSRCTHSHRVRLMAGGEPMFTMWPRRRATMCGMIAGSRRAAPSGWCRSCDPSPRDRLRESSPAAREPALLIRTSGTRPARTRASAVRLTASAVPHVDHRERKRDPVLRAELGRQLLQAVGSSRPEHQIRPFSREPPGTRLADPELAPVTSTSFPLIRFIPPPSLRDVFA